MNTVTLEEISALYEKYVMETYARADLLFVRGQGSYLYDSEKSIWILPRESRYAVSDTAIRR